MYSNQAKMKNLNFILLLFLFASCKTNNSDNTSASKKNDPCSKLKDSIKTNIFFSQADTMLPTKDFYDILDFIESKGNMKGQFNNDIPLKIDFWRDIYLTHVVDTCNHNYLTQFFVLKNVTASSCFFKSTKSLKNRKNYYPRFDFIQWNFANNSDRDSAYNILNWVYNNDDIIIYEYRYNQTVKADKRLYMFETNAVDFADTNIQYAKYLKEYLNGQKNNSH